MLVTNKKPQELQALGVLYYPLYTINTHPFSSIA